MIPLFLAFACQSPTIDQGTAPADLTGRVLEIAAQDDRYDGGNRYNLNLDGAEVLLEIGDPEVNQPPIVSGTGVFEAMSPEHGAAFVATVVKWLGEHDPPLGNGHPGPWKFKYARMSATSEWAVYKILLTDADGQGVLLLRTFAGGAKVEILKKDGEDHTALARMLAVTLRDGPAVGAWIPTSTSLRGSDQMAAAQWCGEGLIGVGRTPTGFALSQWKDLRGQPTQIGAGDGQPGQLLADPTCRHVALAVRYPADPEVYDSADPTEIVVFDLESGAFRVVSGRDETWSLQDAAWSPDGEQLALTAIHQVGTAPFPAVTRVYEAASGKVIATGDPAWDAVPWAWQDSVILRADPFNREPGQPAWYAWDLVEPATGIAPPTLTSPDGTQTLTAERAEGSDPYLMSWVGPHHILAVGETIAVHDLSNDRSQPFHTLGGVQGISIDARGERIALITRAGVRWAPTQP